MKPYKLISAIIGYLLLFQLWPVPEASCSLPCLVSKQREFQISSFERVISAGIEDSYFTPTPMSAIAKW